MSASRAPEKSGATAIKAIEAIKATEAIGKAATTEAPVVKEAGRKARFFFVFFT
jgi:hypothetical protein